MGTSVMVLVVEACEGDDGRAAGCGCRASGAGAGAEGARADDEGDGGDVEAVERADEAAGGGEGEGGCASSSGFAIWRRPRVPTSMVPGALVCSAVQRGAMQSSAEQCRQACGGRTGGSEVQVWW